MWRELLRILNTATVDGLSQGRLPATHQEKFLEEVRHSNEVFAAFKSHDMAERMAALLKDDKGKLRPFEEWRNAVKGIESHHIDAWLRTEYNTAVIRAHNAADWRGFEENKDVMPNLRWMPTTSPNPETQHAVFWKNRLTLPVDDPFWDTHHPGDRWNCKCSLEATDDPVRHVDSKDTKSDKPQAGLRGNMGKTGQTFSDDHPYYPSSCASCPFNHGVKNKFVGIFNSRRKRECNVCKTAKEGIKKLSQKMDIANELRMLQDLHGSEFVNKLKKIAGSKMFKLHEDGIYTVGGEGGEDYDRLIGAARKAVSHGYTVFMLPNPSSTASADYIFERKGIYKMYDLKTVMGSNSVGNRFSDSMDQTNRVLLNISTNYDSRTLARQIKRYFYKNPEALEVLIFKKKEQIIISRKSIEGDFVKNFMRKYK